MHLVLLQNKQNRKPNQHDADWAYILSYLNVVIYLEYTLNLV